MADSTYYGMHGIEDVDIDDDREEVLYLTPEEVKDWKHLPWLIEMKAAGELNGQPVVVGASLEDAEEDEALTQEVYKWSKEKTGGRRRRRTRKTRKVGKKAKHAKKTRKH